MKKLLKTSVIISVIIISVVSAFFLYRWKMQFQAFCPSLSPDTTQSPVRSYSTQNPLYPYVNVLAIKGQKHIFNAGEFSPNDIITFTYDECTVFKGSEDLADEILEKGKNPGLGVRALHAEGITGKGVNVAIIDQNLLLNHPEFKGKIAAYYDTGCDMPADNGSMHAPAVTSLLVGETIGTAPDATVYFAAVPSWNADSKYYADALYWVIEQNRKLPDDHKIRVVSISAMPSGPGTPFKKNTKAYPDAVKEAQKEGILVLDCRDYAGTGFIAPGYYDLSDPDNIEQFNLGYPSQHTITQRPNSIAVPASLRTVAEEYYEGNPSYLYTGEGGLSWSIPYAAGVLAMGWQVAPDLGNKEIIELLYSSCYIDKKGNKIINPPAFIYTIKERK